MTSMGRWLDVAIICTVFVLLSVVGIIWDFTSGLLTSGIDGIMLAAVCLLIVGIFSLMLLMVLHQAGLLPKFGKVKPAAVPAAAKPAVPPAVKPAAPASAPIKSPAAPAATAPPVTQPSTQGKT